MLKNTIAVARTFAFFASRCPRAEKKKGQWQPQWQLLLCLGGSWKRANGSARDLKLEVPHLAPFVKKCQLLALQGLKRMACGL